ncbi:MAG TPA: ATP-binding protein [Persephonella sp.]|nr:ATP-binding protein [Persephonella sp.]
MQNPFYYGGVVSKENFCNRKEEIKQLKRDILSGMNVLIYAPRRFGKTSLVLFTLEQLKKEKNFKYIFLDFLGISSREEFINEYFNGIAQSLETPVEKTIKFFKDVLKIRPSIKVIFDETGRTKFHLEFSKSELSQTLKDVLNIPLMYAEKGKKICVVFDEFQEVEFLGIENEMRSQIQLHSNKVSYIFMGSKKSILKKMFLEKKKAFYRSVKHFQIKEISKKDWIEFIKEKFKNTGKKIDDFYIEKILMITKGFPYYTQQFAYELWELTEDSVNDEIFARAVKLVLEREEDLFAVEWENLSSNQRKTLKIVIEKEGVRLHDEHVLSKYDMKIGSLRKTLLSLLEKDILDRKENKYYFQDPLFEYWLKTKIY